MPVYEMVSAPCVMNESPTLPVKETLPAAGHPPHLADRTLPVLAAETEGWLRWEVSSR